MITKKQLAISLIILIAITFVVWFSRHSAVTITPEHNPTLPDVFMTDVHEIKMNAEGQTKTILKTPKLTNTTENNTTLIHQPHFIAYENAKPSWEIRAKHGKAIHGTDKIILWDHVKMREFPGPKSHHMTLTTSAMTIYPDKNTAETDKPVLITQPGSVVHAIGMHADIKNSVIKLLSQVKGTHNKAEKLNANRALINFKTKQDTYTGKVQAINNTSVLKGDTITTKRNQSNKVVSIISTGQPASYESINEEKNHSSVKAIAKTIKTFPTQNLATLLTQDDQPLNALAKTINIFPQKKQAILINEAKVEHGNTLLKGDQITVQRNDKKQIISVIDIGNPAIYHTTDDQDQKPVDASAKTISIFPQKNQAVLTTAVKVTHDHDILTADNLTIERDNNKKIKLITAQGNPAHYETINESDQKPVVASANMITLFPKTNQAVLTTSVELSNDHSTLKGDTVTIERDINKKIKSIIAKGTPAHYHAITEDNQPPFDATAKIITYKPTEHIAILEKDALARQGAETLQGPLIKYDTQKGVVKSTRSHITIDEEGIARIN